MSIAVADSRDPFLSMLRLLAMFGHGSRGSMCIKVNPLSLQLELVDNITLPIFQPNNRLAANGFSFAVMYS